MKNLLIFAALAAVLWYGWMRMVLEYLPMKEGKKWVEEVRLGVDNGVLTRNFTYLPPLSPEEFLMPKGGIEEHFKMKRISGPTLTDKADSRAIVYSVKFQPSPLAPEGSSSRLEPAEYWLVLKAKGSYPWPVWETIRFRPPTKKERKAHEGAWVLPSRTLPYPAV